MGLSTARENLSDLTNVPVNRESVYVGLCKKSENVPVIEICQNFRVFSIQDTTYEYIGGLTIDKETDIFITIFNDITSLT